MKYQLAVSGWVKVEVEASTPEEAQEKALNDIVAGELYDWVFEEVTEVTE